jgi:hypothetical protein
VRQIPRRMMRDSVTITPLLGESGLGPAYGPAATIRCRANPVRQLVRNSDGEEVVSELTLYVHPADAGPITPKSLVTYAGRDSVVLNVAPFDRPGETVGVKVTCS